jgi:serine phosphatase RsbU (regulator of sigma subunit)
LAKKAFEEKVRILDEKLKQERLEAVTELAIAEGLKETMTQEQFDQFVSDNPDPEWIREDGRIAKEPSRLRMLNRSIRHYIRASLNKALDNGHDIEEAMRIAQEFNVPLREVYALWASP